jgi:tubulin monoglycylase TTLL3/8
MIKDELEKWQIINHFYRNNLLTTKVGLQNSLQNLVWWSNIPQDQFFPKCFDLTDFREQDDFLEEFKVNRAEALLKKFKRKKQCPSNIEKLLVAIFISEKRLSDVDDIIDDLDLQILVNDAEW